MTLTTITVFVLVGLTLGLVFAALHFHHLRMDAMSERMDAMSERMDAISKRIDRQAR